MRGGGEGGRGADDYDDENPIAVETADPEHGDMYDEYDDDDEEMGEGGGEDEGAGGEYPDEEEYGDENNNESSREETEVEKRMRERMADELYKLDYEDLIGDMPTRFKYRTVDKNSYGLSTTEILFAKDTALKQFVSLKKMAPYRQDVSLFCFCCRVRAFLLILL